MVDPRQSLEAASALGKLKERRHHPAVRAAGAHTVYTYAVVFDGKRRWLDVVPTTR